jgi:hypothetical protein
MKKLDLMQQKAFFKFFYDFCEIKLKNEWRYYEKIEDKKYIL